ncbi:peptidoglycan DD-metalloendopeptidase family protein [Paraburkholderia sp. MPAMCS5]|uniref:peptidoglycan DD-metalloendopeptidase family protein n=1 Tax=Paraburkholderia sp. MPAMCS5 TaxID=3112563 RepID=UPI002E192894|nr:peptidoglycan DD-metalloendopeptidase family protein [Paraburkholderia sp. MPAMCS5]
MPRCADTAIPILLAFSLAAALSGCSLPSWGAPLQSRNESPTSDSSADPISAWTNGSGTGTGSGTGSVLAASGEPAVAAGFYRVNRGDTLTAIAHEFGHDVSSLRQWNHLPAGGAVLAGQMLRVGPPAPPESAPAATATHAAAAAEKRVDTASAASRAAKARLAWPVDGALKGAFVAGKTRGITIAARAGEQVKAAANGKVVYAGGGMTSYGRLIIIKHDAHLLTAYGNNQALLVKEGALVKKGQPIAQASAATGDALVNFEVRDDGKPVDPLNYLPNHR